MNYLDKCKEESGVALILTVFILTLASIIVFELVETSEYDLQSSRAFIEGVQAHYGLKSALNIGRVTLELPKIDGYQEDWLGEPWAQISQIPDIPLDNLNGNVKIELVDAQSKININRLTQLTSRNSGNTAQTPDNIYWLRTLYNLFSYYGFVYEKYEETEHRTPGDVAFQAEDQVATIVDWMDKDNRGFRNADFPGKGSESGSNQNFFFNRTFYSLSELPLVPGMTPERVLAVSRALIADLEMPIMPINVNTAPLEVLLALGFTENSADNIISGRTVEPVNDAIRRSAALDDPDIVRRTGTKSSWYEIYVRIELPNSVHWLRGLLYKAGNSREPEVFSGLSSVKKLEMM